MPHGPPAIASGERQVPGNPGKASGALRGTRVCVESGRKPEGAESPDRHGEGRVLKDQAVNSLIHS